MNYFHTTSFTRGNPLTSLDVGVHAKWKGILQDIVPKDRLEKLIQYAVHDSNIRKETTSESELIFNAIHVLARMDNFERVVLVDNPCIMDGDKAIAIQSCQSSFSISNENIQDLAAHHNINMEVEITNMSIDTVADKFSGDNIDKIYIYQLYTATNTISNINNYNYNDSNEMKILSRFYIKEKENEEDKTDKSLKLLIKSGL